jgi:hypothetical protein
VVSRQESGISVMIRRLDFPRDFSILLLINSLRTYFYEGSGESRLSILSDTIP